MNPKNKISVQPGDKYHRWTIIKELPPKIRVGKNRSFSIRIMLCECECGNIGKVQLEGLAHGHSKSCGCLLKDVRWNSRKVYKSGQRFGKLIIIRGVEAKGYDRCFLCKCDCGKETISRLSALKRKGGSSCGCTRRKPMLKNRTENYPYRNHRLYSIWIDMKKRCYNKKSRAYRWYGGSGIEICDEWKSRFLNFYKWAMTNGYSATLTIERINPTKNYEPSNCKWIPWSEQNNNKRNSRIISYQGIKLTVSEAARKYGICYTTLIRRLNSGWNVEDAIELKPIKTIKHVS